MPLESISRMAIVAMIKRVCFTDGCAVWLNAEGTSGVTIGIDGGVNVGTDVGLDVEGNVFGGCVVEGVASIFCAGWAAKNELGEFEPGVREGCEGSAGACCATGVGSTSDDCLVSSGGSSSLMEIVKKRGPRGPCS